MTGLLITGTGSHAGKTVVGMVLAATLRHRGMRVGVMKPVETACPDNGGALQPRDAPLLLDASGSTGELDLVAPYRLRGSALPALEAEREGVTIEVDRIAACYRQLAGMHDLVLVEGTGGLLTPLGPNLTTLDLAKALDLPVLIVARNLLDAVNGTALAASAARARDLRVLGVVLDNVDPFPYTFADPAAIDNAEALRRWGDTPFLGEIPYASGLGGEILRERGGRLRIDLLLDVLRSG